MNLDTTPTITIKPHARARGLTLRYQPHKGQFLLTTPRRIAKRAVDQFIVEQQTWMQRQIALYPVAKAIIAGDTILFLGQSRTIHHHDAAGVNCVLDNDTLAVHCRAPRLQRAVQRFIQQQAAAIITPLVHEKAAILGTPVAAIHFRDTTSRWGSCSRDGKLSFSWRLVMAPMSVVDYVVAHEVAHLCHFDHSARFWQLCRDLSTDFTFGKHWLQQNAALLHTEI